MNLLFAFFVLILYFVGGMLLCTDFVRNRAFFYLYFGCVKVRFEGIKYVASPADGFRILQIQIVLWFKRQKRRFLEFFAKDNFVYLVILIAWIAFALIVLVWGTLYKGSNDAPYRLADVFWEVKSAIFSSLVLALIIGSYNKSTDYRKRIRKQHEFYVDTMRDFDSFLEVFTEGENYMPFYNRMCLDQTLEYVELKYFQDNEEIEFFNKSIYNCLDVIEKRLAMLRDEYISNELISKPDSELHLEWYIKDAKNAIQKIYSAEHLSVEDIKDLSIDLILILDYLRYPWRRDIEYKHEILFILCKYYANEWIRDNFYYTMILIGHPFEYVQLYHAIDNTGAFHDQL